MSEDERNRKIDMASLQMVANRLSCVQCDLEEFNKKMVGRVYGDQMIVDPRQWMTCRASIVEHLEAAVRLLQDINPKCRNLDGTENE